MTEAEWLACTDPAMMLACLPGKASDRKLRLFACACCRRLWPLLKDERSRTGVEISERYADGEIEDEGRREASNAAYRAWDSASTVPDDPGEPPDKRAYGSSRPWRKRPYENDPVARRYLSPHPGIAAFHATYAAFMSTMGVTDQVLSDCQEAVWFAADRDQRSTVAAEERAQASLLRCIFGSLHLRVMAIDQAWLTSTVVSLAQAIYADRAFDQLPILADALADAGCDNADLLAHCRGPGPHCRGCFAVDLILSKDR